MARMIPRTLKHIAFTTAGERKVFNLLATSLPDICTVRFEILVGYQDYRPDFVILDPDRGLIIIEVKDWSIANIKMANAQQFWVTGVAGYKVPRPYPNPSLKCQLYRRDAAEHLIAFPNLVDQTGKLMIPIHALVAFPNIFRKELMDSQLGELLPEDTVLLREDLLRSESFQEQYNKRVAKLSAKLTDEQLTDCRLALFSELALPQVTSPGFTTHVQPVVMEDLSPAEIPTFSLDQEEIAKSIGSGPQLLRGIAGTGKTLIMLYRAKLLAANQPDMRILILCWNTALATYMQQAYETIAFKSRGDVRIVHFTEFARELIGWRSDPSYGWDDKRVMKELQGRKIRNHEKYDAVFVDEAQDFRKEWLEYIFHNLIKGSPQDRQFLLAADDAQKVYFQRDFPWHELDIPLKKEIKVLRTVYRNSARVWIFSAFMLKEKASYISDPSILDDLQFTTKKGYDPQLIEKPNLDAQIEFAVDVIESTIQDHSPNNILVLYRHNPVPWLNYALVERLTTILDSRGIPWDWIAEDAHAKRSFAWYAPRIKISTVHSSKGMDSPFVIILGAETFRPEFSREHGYDEEHLIYVAMTRAREFLMILHTGKGGMVPKLRTCMQEYAKLREQIIAIENR